MKASRGAGRVVLAASIAVGCASTSAEDSYRDVGKTIEQRTGQRLTWNRDAQVDAAVRGAVRRLLEGQLTLPEAVRIALINNRRLQAELEELSIAQADLVQAGLMANPTVGGALGFPLDGGGDPDIGVGVEFDVLSLLYLPARKKIAAAQVETTKARVGDAVLGLAADVKVAYFRLQAAEQSVALLRIVAAAGQATAELAERQRRAGTSSELDSTSQRVLYEDARLALARAEAEVADLREELNRLLGLWGADTQWRVPERLPELPAEDPGRDHLEALAMNQRLDVAAARQALSAASMAASLSRSARWTGTLEAGGEVERDGGEWTAGPTAKLGVPLFDQGQAAVARLEAEVRQAEHRLASTSIDARSEVRQARNRLTSSRALAEHYAKVVLPLRERVVRLAQQQFEAMLIGVYQVLELRRQEIEAYQELVIAVRDYWIARAELERAVGGRLPPAPPRR